MPKATVTGKTGAGSQMTAITAQNITACRIDLARDVLYLESGSNVKDVDLKGATAVTVTLAGQNSSITVT